MPNLYVPILKWKKAEREALRELSDHTKESILPLFELIMPKPASSKASHQEKYNEVLRKFREKEINNLPIDIYTAWGSRLLFLDFSLLYTEVKLEAAEHILSNLSFFNLNVIPVINLVDSEDYKKSLIKLIKGRCLKMCLRITKIELEQIHLLNKSIEKLMDQFDLKPEEVSILIDFKELKQITDSTYTNLIRSVQMINKLNEWNHLIVASGAFPETMSEYKKNEDNFIDRKDWLLWVSQLALEQKRVPIFSDYAVRYPIYNQQFDFYPPTATLKYTLKTRWMIFKGEKNKPQYYLASANLLISQKDYYFGKDFCKGDQYISEKGEYYPTYVKDPSKKGTGGPESWLKASFSHHMTLVVSQLSNQI